MIAYYLDMSDRNDYSHCKCSNCGMTFENYVVVKIGKDSCDYIGVRDSHKFCSKCGCEMKVKKKKFREIK